MGPQATIAGQLVCTTHIPRAFRDHPYFQRATGEPVGSRPRRCRCRASQCPAPRLGGGIIGIGALPSTTCPQFPGACRREMRKCLQKKGLRGSTTATFGGFACPWRSPRGCLGPSPGPLTPLWRSSRRLVGPGAGFQVHDPCRSRPVPRSEPNVVLLLPGHPSSRSQSFSPTPSELVPGLLPAPATTCDSRSAVREQAHAAVLWYRDSWRTRAAPASAREAPLQSAVRRHSAKASTWKENLPGVATRASSCPIAQGAPFGARGPVSRTPRCWSPVTRIPFSVGVLHTGASMPPRDVSDPLRAPVDSCSNQRATSPAARWPSQLPCPGPALPPSAESGKSALAAAQGCTITWAPTGRSS